MTLPEACCAVQAVTSPLLCTWLHVPNLASSSDLLHLQIGSPEVISGIAQRALAVIREAATATGSSQEGSNNAFSASSNGQDPTGNMAGGSASIYSQGPQKGSSGSQQGVSGPAEGAAANTPAMPSMSGANAASVYADQFSDKATSRQTGSKSLFETITGRSKPALAASGITHNATAAEAKSDNMGGGSSAIYSQGPQKQSEGQSDSQKGADTPAMPSMSGPNAASEYSESDQNKNLSGKGTQQGQTSLYETITGKKDPHSKQEQLLGIQVSVTTQLQPTLKLTTWRAGAQQSILRAQESSQATTTVSLTATRAPAHLLCRA